MFEWLNKTVVGQISGQMQTLLRCDSILMISIIQPKSCLKFTIQSLRRFSLKVSVYGQQITNDKWLTHDFKLIAEQIDRIPSWRIDISLEQAEAGNFVIQQWRTRPDYMDFTKQGFIDMGFKKSVFIFLSQLKVFLRLKDGVCGQKSELKSSYCSFVSFSRSCPLIMIIDSSTSRFPTLMDDLWLFRDYIVFASSRVLSLYLFWWFLLSRKIICLTTLPCSFFCLILYSLIFLKEQNFVVLVCDCIRQEQLREFQLSEREGDENSLLDGELGDIFSQLVLEVGLSSPRIDDPFINYIKCGNNFILISNLYIIPPHIPVHLINFSEVKEIQLFLLAMQRPLMIFIVGTTAVGKTKLSIQLCKAIGGEVINCDSKQLYKYANIMTAKASSQEIEGVRHHMLDVLQLHQNCYNRNKYYNEAIKCVNDIKSRGKVPVVVGGTNYYLETLLYDIDIKQGDSGEQFENKEEKQDQQKKEQVEPSDRISKSKIASMSKDERYAYLKEVDPVMGEKLHPNDDNRITRFLQRYSQTGIRPSTVYKPYIHKLRFQNSVLLWIRNSNKKELHDLMESRVGKMVDTGGLMEAVSIFKYAEMHGLLEGLKMGALQSIGYKEFYGLYQQIKQILSDQQFDSKERTYSQIEERVRINIDKIKQKASKIHVKSIRTNKDLNILQNSIQILTKNTIDYSKRQVTWIRNRLFACEGNRSNFFVLELANKDNAHKNLMERFELNVKNKALDILKGIQQNGIGSVKEDLKQFNVKGHESILEWKKYKCQECGIEVNGNHQWKQHLNSRRHRRSTSKKERKMRKRKQKLDQKSVESQKQENSESDEENANLKVRTKNE